MKITTKELRIQPGKIINQVAHGQEITVTFRGKALARIVPFKNNLKANDQEEISLFGLWKDHEKTRNVEEHIRNIRKGCQF